jgi:hypothetical protein
MGYVSDTGTGGECGLLKGSGGFTGRHHWFQKTIDIRHTHTYPHPHARALTQVYSHMHTGILTHMRQGTNGVGGGGLTLSSTETDMLSKSRLTVMCDANPSIVFTTSSSTICVMFGTVTPFESGSPFPLGAVALAECRSPSLDDDVDLE